MQHLRNFSYVIEGKLAGSANPGSGKNLASALAELREAGFTAVLTLFEFALESAAFEKAGVENLHLPIQDFTAPSIEQVERAVDYIGGHSQRGGGVLVHCMGGYGRTGTILACYLVAEGADAATAIDTIRRLRPGSIEVADQERVIQDYEQRLREARMRSKDGAGSRKKGKGKRKRRA